MSTVEENRTTERSSSASNDSSTKSEAVQTYPVDFFIVTRFPEVNYRFKWLLNQFSKLPIESEICSPIVHDLCTSPCRLKLVKNETELILFHVIELQSKIKHGFGETEEAKVNSPFVIASPQESQSFCFGRTRKERESQGGTQSFCFGSSTTKATSLPSALFSSQESQSFCFGSSQESQHNITGSCLPVRIPGEQKEATDEDSCTPKLQYEVSAEDFNGKQLIKWFVSFTKGNQLQSQAIGKYASASLTNLPNDMLILDCHLKVILAPTSEKQIFKTQLTLGCNRWKKLSTDLKDLYQNPVDADVTLHVGVDEVRAHRSILAARSTVFKKIFHHDMKENEQNSVVINDVPLSAVQKLIEFLYTGVIQEFNIDVSLQDLYNLYYAADKYEVMDLRNMCGNTMLSRATFKNASQMLMWADRHNDEDLKSDIMNFIRMNFKAVSGTHAWESCLVNETRLAAEVVRLCAKKL